MNYHNFSNNLQKYSKTTNTDTMAERVAAQTITTFSSITNTSLTTATAFNNY